MEMESDSKLPVIKSTQNKAKPDMNNGKMCKHDQNESNEPTMKFVGSVQNPSDIVKTANNIKAKGNYTLNNAGFKKSASPNQRPEKNRGNDMLQSEQNSDLLYAMQPENVKRSHTSIPFENNIDDIPVTEQLSQMLDTAHVEPGTSDDRLQMVQVWKKPDSNISYKGDMPEETSQCIGTANTSDDRRLMVPLRKNPVSETISISASGVGITRGELPRAVDENMALLKKLNKLVFIIAIGFWLVLLLAIIMHLNLSRV